MSKKDNAEKVLRIVKDYKSQSNKDLVFAMDFIQDDFTNTKETLVKLTHHLDKLENTYNLILKEYEKRNKTK
jgi:adenine C2-methylase RlmN of 23S rRNA A2503 and tRNA A37